MNAPRAAEVWSDGCAPGGYVCAYPAPGAPDGICGYPVESEPCPDHAEGEWACRQCGAAYFGDPPDDGLCPVCRAGAAALNGGLRVFSFGGGWQSTAALVLASRGALPFRVFLFANVGDDSEHPGTLAYVRAHAAPFAAAHGVELHELSRLRRDGTTETLYGRLTRDGSRSLPIPVRMSNGAPGTRSCTADFKIKVVGRWLKAHGAAPGNPATVGIGISLDEIERANTRRAEPHERIVYPLLDLRIRRADCPRIIRSAGLPVPPKSACWFCPLHRVGRWADMRRDEPALFTQACGLEATLNTRRAALGKDPVWLTRYGKPLAEAVPRADDMLPLDLGDGACDSGWCFT